MILIKQFSRTVPEVGSYGKLVIVRVHLSMSSRLRARDVLMVRMLNKCTLFLDRQGTILYTPQYFHTPVYWLSS